MFLIVLLVNKTNQLKTNLGNAKNFVLQTVENKKITKDTKKTISVYVNAKNAKQIGCYVELDKMTKNSCNKKTNKKYH